MKTAGSERPARGERLSGEALLYNRLRASPFRVLFVAVMMVVLGMAGLLWFVRSVESAAPVVGFLVLIFGGLTLVVASSIHSTGPIFGALVVGIFSVAAGAFLFLNPLAGAVDLRLVVGVIFVLKGAFELTFALDLRPNSGWEGLLISGLASAVLALVLAAGWPAIEVTALRILLGVSFLIAAFAYIYLFNSLRANTNPPNRWALQRKKRRSREEVQPAKVSSRK